MKYIAQPENIALSISIIAQYTNCCSQHSHVVIFSILVLCNNIDRLWETSLLLHNNFVRLGAALRMMIAQ